MEDSITTGIRRTSDGKWYLFDSNGRAYRNCRAKNGIDTYYFNDDGSMYTGWKEENGKTYYYRDWGGMAYSMTLTIDGVRAPLISKVNL